MNRTLSALGTLVLGCGLAAACSSSSIPAGSDGNGSGLNGDAAAPDGATCCPVGWLFYSCTFEDGGQGHACHNPELGCSSSTTCGQGCDEVVSDRCEGDSGPPPADGGIGGDSGPPVDAGDCCPVGWYLYGCTFTDGGQGQACHNPALGCASSLTCGEGCDSVVSGRCP